MIAPPRVAVLIPCFDDGATLEQAVDSALGQDEAAEVVVVDDGSTDPATLAAFDRLAARGVRVVHQPNRGPGAARMAALGATSAPAVLPLDADDLLPPGALRSLREALDAHPEVGAVWGWYQRFGQGSWVQRTSPRLDPWHITHQNDLAPALFRRSALALVGGWGLRSAYEDWDLWMALAEHGVPGLGIPRVTYHYRLHGLRRLGEASRGHGSERVDLRARHPRLFAARRRAWWRSRAPLALRLALPMVGLLPLPEHHRRLLAGVACHLAYRRGVLALVRRARVGA